MNKSNYIIALIFSIVLPNLLFAGGGWPQSKGKGYLKLSEWWIISNQHYTDAGLLDPNVTTGIFNSSIYAEYGLTDRLTAVLYFPFFSRTYQNNIVSGTTDQIIFPGESLNGIGDTDISIKYGLTKPGSGLAVATTFTLGLPFGNDDGGSLGQLQLGDGEFNQQLMLDAGIGWQLGNTPFYSNIGIGFNNRNGGFSDELRYTFELGGHFLNKKLWVIGRVSGVESLKNGESAASNVASSIFANNTEYVSIGAELAYNVHENWGFSVGVTSAIRGEIILANPSYTVGVFTKF